MVNLDKGSTSKENSKSQESAGGNVDDLREILSEELNVVDGWGTYSHDFLKDIDGQTYVALSSNVDEDGNLEVQEVGEDKKSFKPTVMRVENGKLLPWKVGDEIVRVKEVYGDGFVRACDQDYNDLGIMKIDEENPGHLIPYTKGGERIKIVEKNKYLLHVDSEDSNNFYWRGDLKGTEITGEMIELPDNLMGYELEKEENLDDGQDLYENYLVEGDDRFTIVNVSGVGKKIRIMKDPEDSQKMYGKKGVDGEQLRVKETEETKHGTYFGVYDKDFNYLGYMPENNEGLLKPLKVGEKSLYITYLYEDSIRVLRNFPSPFGRENSFTVLRDPESPHEIYTKMLHDEESNEVKEVMVMQEKEVAGQTFVRVVGANDAFDRGYYSVDKDDSDKIHRMGIDDTIKVVEIKEKDGQSYGEVISKHVHINSYKQNILIDDFGRLMTRFAKYHADADKGKEMYVTLFESEYLDDNEIEGYFNLVQLVVPSLYDRAMQYIEDPENPGDYLYWKYPRIRGYIPGHVDDAKLIDDKLYVCDDNGNRFLADKEKIGKLHSFTHAGKGDKPLSVKDIDKEYAVLKKGWQLDKAWKGIGIMWRDQEDPTLLHGWKIIGKSGTIKEVMASDVSESSIYISKQSLYYSEGGKSWPHSLSALKCKVKPDDKGTLMTEELGDTIFLILDESVKEGNLSIAAHTGYIGEVPADPNNPKSLYFVEGADGEKYLVTDETEDHLYLRTGSLEESKKGWFRKDPNDPYKVLSWGFEGIRIEGLSATIEEDGEPKKVIDKVSLMLCYFEGEKRKRMPINLQEDGSIEIGKLGDKEVVVAVNYGNLARLVSKEGELGWAKVTEDGSVDYFDCDILELPTKRTLNKVLIEYFNVDAKYAIIKDLDYPQFKAKVGLEEGKNGEFILKPFTFDGEAITDVDKTTSELAWTKSRDVLRRSQEDPYKLKPFTLWGEIALVSGYDDFDADKIYVTGSEKFGFLSGHFKIDLQEEGGIALHKGCPITRIEENESGKRVYVMTKNGKEVGFDYADEEE